MDDASKTRWTLIGQLKNLDDERSWKDFNDRYRPLIVNFAKKAGLRTEEAQEVAQETMASVAKTIQNFVIGSEHGSFRAWLLRMARWRIADQFRKRTPIVQSGEERNETRTPEVERIPNDGPGELERLWDIEWSSWLLGMALRELPSQISADQFQIFHMLTVEQMPVSKVAALVGHVTAHIYLAKHRASKALNKILKRLEKEWG
jgi:RNA polymerase sigma factor (sigma-70 family)